MTRWRARSLSLAGFMAVSVWAADTPSNMPGPGEASGLMGQARAAIQQHDWDLALALLEQAHAVGLDSADLHNLLGYSLRMKRTPDVKRAVQHYQLALDRNPSHLGVHEYLGEAYLMLDDPQSAQRHLDILRKLCAQVDCEERRDLERAVADYLKGASVNSRPSRQYSYP